MTASWLTKRHWLRWSSAIVVPCVIGAAVAEAQSAAATSPGSASRTLESFDDAGAFRALPSDGVRLALTADSGVVGGALRLTFDFQGHAGYAVARRAFSLGPLPERWVATLWVRGEARRNTLELKLVDSSGSNVDRRARTALVNGVAAPLIDGGRAVVTRGPAVVELRY